MAAGKDGRIKQGTLTNAGQAITTSLTSAVDARQIAYVNGLTGFTGDSGASGDYVSLIRDTGILWSVEIPSALTPDVGDVLYVDPANLTGHTPDDPGGFSLTRTAGFVPVLKIIGERYQHDSKWYVDGFFIDAWEVIPS